MIDTNMLKEEYIDQVTAAQMLGVTQARVSQLCSQERFSGAMKIGWSWIIPKEAVKNFVRSPRGRKPKLRDNKPSNLEGGLITYDQ